MKIRIALIIMWSMYLGYTITAMIYTGFDILWVILIILGIWNIVDQCKKLTNGENTR